MNTRFFFLLLPLAAVCTAAEPQTVFDAHSNLVDGTSLTVVSNTLFYAARIHANSRPLAHAALNEILTQELVSKCLSYWPERPALKRSVQRELLLDYVKLQGGFREILPKLKTVYRYPADRGDGDADYVRVWGIDEAAFTNEMPTWTDVTAITTNRDSFPYPDLNPLAVLEIVPNDLRLDAIHEFERRLRFAHGALCADVIAGKRPKGFSLAEYTRINRRSLHDLTFQQLFNALGTMPYHPAVLAEMAERYEAAGLHVAASLMARRGQIMPFMDTVSARACEQLIAQNAAFVGTNTTVNLDSFESFPDAAQLIRPLFLKAVFRGSALTVLGLWGRPFPGGSLEMPTDEAFKKAEQLVAKTNQLLTAYGLYCRSVEQQISFEACRRAGKLAHSVGNPYEAIVLLLQAAMIDPGKTDVWKELAEIGGTVEEKEFAEYCRKKSIGRKSK